MLKKYLLAAAFLISLTVYGQPDKKLASAFIQSVAKNNFALLEPYLLNATAAKSLYGNEFNKMTPAKQTEAITKMRAQLKSKWTVIVNNAKASAIDFSKLQLNQVVTSPVEGNKMVNALLATYFYNGSEWDDIFLIVNEKGEPRYITEIPSHTALFTLNESRRGKNLKEIQTQRDKNDPDVKKNLSDAVLALQKLAEKKDTQQILRKMVYTGEQDINGRWKRAIDPSNADDVASGKRIFEKLTVRLSECHNPSFGDVRMEKESEGVWYVIKTTCGERSSAFAFLKIDNEFVLGDVD
jgi:hypothetical protein